MAVAIASAIKQWPVDNRLAMTGEIGVHGKVKPVGGVLAKAEAAFQAGATRVLIPKENWQEIFANLSSGLQVIPVETIDEVLRHTFASQLGEDAIHLPKLYERASGSSVPLFQAKATDVNHAE